MPQLLSRVNPRAGVILANSGLKPTPVEARPRLALHAMETIASWSNVEMFMLRAYVKLAGGSKSKAARLFVKLDTNRAKSQALLGLSEEFSDEGQRLFAKLLKWIKSNQKQRDKIAHWVWGYSPDIENGLLLHDPRQFALDDEFDVDIDQTYIYYENDFTELIHSNYKLALFGTFVTDISENPTSGQHKPKYALIMSQPEFADVPNHRA